jgi:hypothetical protein
MKRPPRTSASADDLLVRCMYNSLPAHDLANRGDHEVGRRAAGRAAAAPEDRLDTAVEVGVRAVDEDRIIHGRAKLWP